MKIVKVKNNVLSQYRLWEIILDVAVGCSTTKQTKCPKCAFSAACAYLCICSHTQLLNSIKL